MVPMGEPVVRDAASVVLIRDGAAGVEVFAQRRVPQMAFAAGMTVFPGGGVEDRDYDGALPWSGPGPEVFADVFGVTTERARAAVCAAVRETFEECGVLLAAPASGGDVGGPDVGGTDLAAMARGRGTLAAGEVSLAEFLADNGLVLRADLLRPLANWVTPAGERRRYDTRFFAALLPPGQAADAETSEAASADWRGAADILRAWREGADILLPPTWSQLVWLARHRDAVGAWASLTGLARVEVVEPVIVRDGGAFRVEFGESEQYYAQGPGHPWAR